jgi:hypothetical protein
MLPTTLPRLRALSRPRTAGKLGETVAQAVTDVGRVVELVWAGPSSWPRRTPEQVERGEPPTYADRRAHVGRHRRASARDDVYSVLAACAALTGASLYLAAQLARALVG